MRLLQGVIIGLGAVLPGVSGGVLCVAFGIYKPVMELLSHPVRAFKTQMRLLFPVLVGAAMGFLGISKLLGFFLTAYPAPSICLFAGLIIGMQPSLFKEAGVNGRGKAAFFSLEIAFLLTTALLLGLHMISTTIALNPVAYLFCGFCVALSVIVPGMSFSTLLMPLGLYTPLVTGIGNLDLEVITLTGIGAILTVVVLARGVTIFMQRFYTVAYHAILGIVIAATVYIIPYKSFTLSLRSGLLNGVCIVAGIGIALLLEKCNRKIKPQ
ncbi:MAG: DUF368 domain-containing protein [Clostridia bacterium]|nr:DUF368 domain-containing protein [Clostridia bacterium]